MHKIKNLQKKKLKMSKFENLISQLENATFTIMRFQNISFTGETTFLNGKIGISSFCFAEMPLRHIKRMRHIRGFSSIFLFF